MVGEREYENLVFLFFMFVRLDQARPLNFWGVVVVCCGCVVLWCAVLLNEMMDVLGGRSRLPCCWVEA